MAKKESAEKAVREIRRKTRRRFSAEGWMRRGASEREVQELLGHRTWHATPRYTRLADQRLESIVGRRRRDEG